MEVNCCRLWYMQGGERIYIWPAWAVLIWILCVCVCVCVWHYWQADPLFILCVKHYLQSFQPNSFCQYPRFKSHLHQDFSGWSHTSDVKIGTPVATLPGAWRYSISPGTGRPGVSILWLCKMESLIWNFYLRVAACKIVWADPSLRYANMLLGCSAVNKQFIPVIVTVICRLLCPSELCLLYSFKWPLPYLRDTKLVWSRTCFVHFLTIG